MKALLRGFLFCFLASPLLAQTPDAVSPAEAVTASPAPSPSPTPARPTAPLTLEDAIQRALENNPDIRVEKYVPLIGEQGVREAKGSYDPLATAALSRSSATAASTNPFDSGTMKTTRSALGVSELLPTGGTASLNFTNLGQNTTNPYTTFNPSDTANLGLNLTQPLLKDFKIDAYREQLRIAKGNRDISDAQFQQQVVNTVASVKTLYYELIYAFDNLAAQHKSLDLAQRLLGENRIRVRVGTLAPLDVVEAESEVASREQGAILAEAALADAQDALRRAITPLGQADAWDIDFAPVDRPSAAPVAVDINGAIGRALASRTDVIVARKTLENAQTTARFAGNQTLPQLDLVGSYGTAGVGGTAITRQSPGGPIISTVPGGAGDAFASVFGGSYPTWSVGINFAYPIGNRAASARAASAGYQRDQAAASLQRTELDATIEVRRAGRAVETNFKRVESTRAARVLQDRRLDAENKRFAAGMSTNFLVTQAQRDLALADVDELRALADYRESLATFDRVQQSGGVGVNIVGAGGAATGTSATGSTGTTGSTAGTTGTSGTTGSSSSGTTGTSGSTSGTTGTSGTGGTTPR